MIDPIRTFRFLTDLTTTDAPCAVSFSRVVFSPFRTSTSAWQVCLFRTTSHPPQIYAPCECVDRLVTASCGSVIVTIVFLDNNQTTRDYVEERIMQGEMQILVNTETLVGSLITRAPTTVSPTRAPTSGSPTRAPTNAVRRVSFPAPLCTLTLF